MNCRLKTLFAREWFYEALTISLLIIFTFIFFLLIRKPPYMSDPLDYLYAGGNPVDLSPSHRHLRIGLIWPLWALRQVFGYSELSYYALPLLGLLTLSISTYLIGKVFFSRTVGVAASLLVIVNPAVLENGTRLFPDFLSSGLFTLAIGILLQLSANGLLRQRNFPRSDVVWLLVAGLLVGWSYLVREHQAIFFPLIILILVSNKASIQTYLGVGIGAAACWVAELAWGWTIYGNPLIRLATSGSPRENDNFQTDVARIILQLPERFLTVGNSWIFVLLFGVGIVVCLWFWSQRSRNWKILSAWFIGGWLFFTVVALLPVFFFDGEVFLRMHRLRYWVILFPPMLLASVAGLMFLMEKIRISKHLQLAVFSILLLAAGLEAINAPDNFEFVSIGSNHYAEFRSFIREHGSEYPIIWLNRGSVITSDRTIPMYLLDWHGLSAVWTGEIEFYNGDRFSYSDLSDLSEGGLLVLDRTFMNALIRDHQLPDYILNLDLLGEPVFESSNSVVIAFDIPAETTQ